MFDRGAIILCLAALLLPAGVPVSAAEPEPGHRSPADMTMQERARIMESVHRYNDCVYREAMARVAGLPDIRQAAELAMEACKGTLDQIGTTIAGYNFEPGFAEQFEHHTQSRVVRILIPELAIRNGQN